MDGFVDGLDDGVQLCYEFMFGDNTNCESATQPALRDENSRTLRTNVDLQTIKVSFRRYLVAPKLEEVIVFTPSSLLLFSFPDN